MRPQVQTLLMSGYTNLESAGQALVGDNDVFLEKPFTQSMLAAKVDEVLGASAGA